MSKHNRLLSLATRLAQCREETNVPQNLDALLNEIQAELVYLAKQAHPLMREDDDTQDVSPLAR